MQWRSPAAVMFRAAPWVNRRPSIMTSALSVIGMERQKRTISERMRSLAGISPQCWRTETPEVGARDQHRTLAQQEDLYVAFGSPMVWDTLCRSLRFVEPKAIEQPGIPTGSMTERWGYKSPHLLFQELCETQGRPIPIHWPHDLHTDR